MYMKTPLFWQQGLLLQSLFWSGAPEDMEIELMVVGR
jgi:hypothetical protein